MSLPPGPDPVRLEARAWGWLSHLRDGGTTPWFAWATEATPAGRDLPGALHLELLRRVNLARAEVGAPGASGGTPNPATVERILHATPTGRELVDRPLVGLGGGYGPPPVWPAELGDRALLRLAASALADVLADEPPPDAAEPPLPRPWHPAYRLVGDPWLARSLRAELVRRGRPPGGRRPRHLVLGTNLEVMLAHVWVTLVTERPTAEWLAWLGGWAHREATPPRADLVRSARRASQLVGRDRVRVVLDPSAPARLLRVRHLPPAPQPPSADAVEVVRRIGRALTVRLPDAHRTPRLRRLLADLTPTPGPPLAVPDALVGWVRDRASRMAADLRADGYPVEGEPGVLTGRGAPGAAPTDGGALTVAVRLLVEDGARHDPEEVE